MVLVISRIIRYSVYCNSYKFQVVDSEIDQQTRFYIYIHQQNAISTFCYAAHTNSKIPELKQRLDNWEQKYKKRTTFYLHFLVPNQPITSILLLSNFFVLRNCIQDSLPQVPPPRTNLNCLRQDHWHAGATTGNINLNSRRGNPKFRLEKGRGTGTHGRSHKTFHSPTCLRIVLQSNAPINPIGLHSFQRATENQILILIDLKLNTACNPNAISANIRNLRGFLVEPITTKGNRSGVGGRNLRPINLKGNTNFASQVTQIKMVGNASNHTGRNPNIEKPNLKPSRMSQGRAIDIRIRGPGNGHGRISFLKFHQILEFGFRLKRKGERRM